MFDPRTLPNGAFWPNLGLFVTFGLMIGAEVADYVTTVKGLAEGKTEGNAIQKFLFSKMGVAGGSFAGMLATLLIGFVILGVAGIGPATLYAGIIAVGEIIQSIVNYRKL